MWTFNPKHKLVNSGSLFHRTPFDREYPHPLNDFFWRVYQKIQSWKSNISLFLLMIKASANKNAISVYAIQTTQHFTY